MYITVHISLEHYYCSFTILLKLIFRNLFEKSLSFSVVRHPFERLVSAYQNKFADHHTSRFARYLKSHYGAISFSMFVKMILEQSEKNYQQKNSCKMKMNNHWKPFITRCAYCDVSYSIIARAETIREDQRYIGHMANVTFYELGKIRIKFIIYVCQIFLFPVEINKSHGGSTKENAMKYFSEIDFDSAKRLYELYKVDFEMFDYSPDEYFKLSRKS